MTSKPVRVLGTQAWIKVVAHPNGTADVKSNIDDLDAIRHFLNEALKSCPHPTKALVPNGSIYTAAPPGTN